MDHYGIDLIVAISCALMLLAYYVFMLMRSRRDPDFSMHAINHKARLLWVRDVMRHSGKDVMAVQTLRNLEMAATFKGSSAILLILGTLTLSSQADSLAKTWHVFSPGASPAAGLWTVKILCLLTVLILAFFAFAMTIRLLNHVVFMLNLPPADAFGVLSPEKVARRLNRAARFYTIGMRAFFFAVPLAFWLFGPWFLLGATVALIAILYQLDHNPLTAQD